MRGHCRGDIAAFERDAGGIWAASAGLDSSSGCARLIAKHGWGGDESSFNAFRGMDDQGGSCRAGEGFGHGPRH